MSDEKNAQPQMARDDAADSAATRLDDTDVGDWGRSNPGAGPISHSPAAAPQTREAAAPGDPLDSGVVAAPLAGEATGDSRAAASVERLVAAGRMVPARLDLMALGLPPDQPREKTISEALAEQRREA